MINVQIWTEKDIALFKFDDGKIIKKKIGNCKSNGERAYNIVRKYRESCRDWLFIVRGDFSVKERKFERLFRFTKRR